MVGNQKAKFVKEMKHEDVVKVKKELVKRAKEKREASEYFRNGGTVEKFKPKGKVVRPI